MIKEVWSLSTPGPETECYPLQNFTFIRMDIDALRSYCLNKKAVTEELPFGPDTLVFKVAGKIFALAPLDPFDSINLKCDPGNVEALREQYEAVQPGYHMNKKHWNTIRLDGSITQKMLKQWIDDSYNLVVASLTKKQREMLK